MIAASIQKLLPEGWTAEQWTETRVVITTDAPKHMRGYATLDGGDRVWRLGYSSHGPGEGGVFYNGRSWKERMTADAVKRLKELA